MPPLAESLSVRPAPPGWARPARILVGVWSAAYLALGLAWLAGAEGNPGDPAVDPAAGLNLLGLLGPVGGPALLAALASTGLALTIAASARRSGVTCAVRVAGPLAILLGVLLAVALPDMRVLASLGYAPVLLVMAVMGTLPEQAVLLDWPLLNQLILTAAGVVWTAVGIVWLGSARRGVARPAWTRPAAVARWGRWATVVAVVVPLGYAVTRYAWALGIPLGVSAESFEGVREIAPAGAGLATGAVVGAVLTWGLTRPWGETFPRWLPGIGGREVPLALAVVPAVAVAAAVTSAGLMFIRVTLSGDMGEHFPVGMRDVAGWLPELFWPLWGVALAAATLAYVLRRLAADQRPGRTSPDS